MVIFVAVAVSCGALPLDDVSSESGPMMRQGMQMKMGGTRNKRQTQDDLSQFIPSDLGISAADLLGKPETTPLPEIKTTELTTTLAPETTTTIKPAEEKKEQPLEKDGEKTKGWSRLHNWFLFSKYMFEFAQK